MIERTFNRRTFLQFGAAAAALGLGAPPAFAEDGVAMRPIPRTGERIPAIGMGTWITFNVGGDETERQQRVEVLRRFFAMGGGMIDSSPMYGSSEDVVGYCLGRLDDTDDLFSATKVWTPSTWHGEKQMNASERLWDLETFDLFQVHNLVNWEGHLETLKERKAQGRIRHIGITTSHGMRHEELARVMQRDDIDFVQLTYNILDREAEARLLPMAADNGVAVICNRPFRRGRLLDMFQSEPLPGWATDAGAQNWPQFLLKFIVSHPAVTCAIPATSRPDHMNENMGALTGPLPDAKMRVRMADYVRSL